MELFPGYIQISQIPEEEKNIGPHDRLIHVYHFTKDTAQNQMVNSFNWFISFCIFLNILMSFIFHANISCMTKVLYFCFTSKIYSKFKTLGNLFSWLYTKVKLYLKLKSVYRRNFKFLTKSLARYILTCLGSYLSSFQFCKSFRFAWWFHWTKIDCIFYFSLPNCFIIFLVWPVEVCFSIIRASWVPSGFGHCIQSFSGALIET